MRQGDQLLGTARRLARASPQRPRQADLKRAISTAYYAVFHTLAQECADRFVGTGQRRNEPAWRQAYRALEHGFAKHACYQVANLGFPPAIVDFGNAFIQLQEERHRADYDPAARSSRAEAQVLVGNAGQAISDLKRANRSDRTALAGLVLLKRCS